MEDGKEADSVQRQINRRTLSIKMTDNGIGRHFVQCVTRSCEERMISLKIPIPKLFLLAKSSKAPFVRDDIKLLTSQKWDVIEKDVRSENGRRGNQGAVRSVANQMELKTGEVPTLVAAAYEMTSLGGRRSQDSRRIGTRGCATENCKIRVQQIDGYCNPCHKLVPKNLTSLPL